MSHSQPGHPGRTRSDTSPWAPLLRGEAIEEYFEGTSFPPPDPERASRVARAIAQLNCPAERQTLYFVMTSRHEDDQVGVRALAVCPAAVMPVLIAVAVAKGHKAAPLIRDSRTLAVNGVPPDDRLVLRKFPGPEQQPNADDGPLDALALRTLITGAPILDRARTVFDCELVHHFDLEADHEMYIGLVLDARPAPPRPQIADTQDGRSARPDITPPWS